MYDGKNWAIFSITSCFLFIFRETFSMFRKILTELLCCPHNDLSTASLLMFQMLTISHIHPQLESWGTNVPILITLFKEAFHLLATTISAYHGHGIFVLLWLWISFFRRRPGCEKNVNWSKFPMCITLQVVLDILSYGRWSQSMVQVAQFRGYMEDNMLSHSLFAKNWVLTCLFIDNDDFIEKELITQKHIKTAGEEDEIL